jgi:hypothetical protein
MVNKIGRHLILDLFPSHDLKMPIAVKKEV